MLYYHLTMRDLNRQQTEGYLQIILHAHLPYIRYPEHEEHLEELWLHEAITESYLPLLGVFEDLLNDRTDFRITLSLTPSLLEMLSDGLLMARYQRYIDSRVDLAEREIVRTRSEPALHQLAVMYHTQFVRTRERFETSCRRDIVSAFRSLAGSGRVELITSAATHAYLPLHMNEPESIRLQLELGVRSFMRHIGQRPAGLWLPECGYAPGLDRAVAEAGLGYFFLEGHGLLNAEPRPAANIYRPIRTEAGPVAFGRDPESSRQVWSADTGYPGDPDYRDFYRDIGFDLDHEYLRACLPGGTRTFTGMKYFRITGRKGPKEVYNPQQGIRKAALHAEHFMQEREAQILSLRAALGKRPLITAAYDAELFGHWWHEGPEWLRFVLRNLSLRQRPFRLTTPSEYIAADRVLERAAPAASSWGQKGYSAVWLDPSNSWRCRHLRKAAAVMKMLAEKHRAAGGLPERALNQALRELLLSQASDWPFMIRMNSASRFAEEKLREHLGNFFMLSNGIEKGSLRQETVEALEKKTSIFRELDFRSYSLRRGAS